MRITKLPGTTIDANIENNCADKIFTPMFYSGGLVLSQVAQITGLEGYIIQNWVKRKYLSHPENKKYTRCQLCRILNINILKDCFTLDQTEEILSYISNSLKAENNHSHIDDSDLYSYFTNVLAVLQSNSEDMLDVKKIDFAISVELLNSSLKSQIACKRLSTILRIMVISYESLEIKNRALELYKKLDFK